MYGGPKQFHTWSIITRNVATIGLTITILVFETYHNQPRHISKAIVCWKRVRGVKIFSKYNPNERKLSRTVHPRSISRCTTWQKITSLLVADALHEGCNDIIIMQHRIFSRCSSSCFVIAPWCYSWRSCTTWCLTSTNQHPGDSSKNQPNTTANRYETRLKIKFALPIPFSPSIRFNNVRCAGTAQPCSGRDPWTPPANWPDVPTSTGMLHFFIFWRIHGKR